MPFLQISKAIENFNNLISKANIFQFQLISYADEFKIVGSMDLAYYHEVDLTFENVSFISCPWFWDDTKYLKLATLEDIEELNIKQNFLLEETEHVFIFDGKTGKRKEPEKFYIIAENIKFTFGTIYYYQRENLKKDEKIADWVK